MTPNMPESVYDSDGPLSFKMLEYSPRPWWSDDAPNMECTRKHLSRRLRSAGLDLELGATMVDLRWIDAHAHAGGILGLKNDLDILESVVDEEAESTRRTYPSCTQYELL